VQWVVTELFALPGVALVRFLFKQFNVPFNKPKLIAHNMLNLHRLRDSESWWHGETITLRGQIEWQGSIVFRTHLAQAYPPDLGLRYGALVAEALELRLQAKEKGELAPFAADVSASNGLPLSMQHAKWLNDDSTGWSGKGLVPHGLGSCMGVSPVDHVEWARGSYTPQRCRLRLILPWHLLCNMGQTTR
jgi:hypothetical protein